MKTVRAYQRQEHGTLEIVSLPCDATGIYTPYGDKLSRTDHEVVLLGWPDKRAVEHVVMNGPP